MPYPLAVLAAAATVTFPSTGAKLSVEVTGRTGDLCTVTLTRGGQTKVKHVDLNGYGIASFEMRLAGRGKPVAKAKCRLARRPHLVAGQTVVTRLQTTAAVPTHIRYEVAGPRGFTDLYDRRLEGIFDGWDSVQIQTFRRSTFSADFRRVLFSGLRIDGERTHVGVLDLRTLKVTDLTARRGGSGCDYSPGFLGRSRPVAGYGSDRVLVYSGGAPDADGVCADAEQRVTSVSDPKRITDFGGGHPEATEWGFPQGGGLNGIGGELVFIGDLPAPDGRYYTDLDPRNGVVGFRRARDREYTLGDCPSFDDVRLLGWLTPRTFGVTGDGKTYRVTVPSGRCAPFTGTVHTPDLAPATPDEVVTFNEVGPAYR